jgi:hypothetical protein
MLALPIRPAVLSALRFGTRRKSRRSETRQKKCRDQVIPTLSPTANASSEKGKPLHPVDFDVLA